MKKISQQQWIKKNPWKNLQLINLHVSCLCTELDTRNSPASRDLLLPEVLKISRRVSEMLPSWPPAFTAMTLLKLLTKTSCQQFSGGCKETCRILREGLKNKLEQSPRKMLHCLLPAVDCWCLLLMSTVDVHCWCPLLMLTFDDDCRCRLLMSTVDVDCWCRLLMSTVDVNCWCWLLMPTIYRLPSIIYRLLPTVYCLLYLTDPV